MIGRLNYFIREGFPGDRAHHIQIARQAVAFQLRGVPTTLIVPEAPTESPQDIQRRYGLQQPLDLLAISSAGFMPRFVRDAMYKSSLAKFVRSAPAGSVFYGRSSGKLPMPVVLDERGDRPVFLEVHSGDFDGWEEHLPKATGLIAISKALGKELVRRGIPENRVLVAHDGVNLSDYQAKLDASFDIPRDLPWVMFTGHLYPDRGGEILVEASKQVAAPHRLVFVGGDPKDIERVSSTTPATFVGHQPPSQVASWQMAAAVLVMPYRSTLSTREWCSPLKLFEYMAAGAPIVSSDLPTIREVLRHEENALLVPPDDPAALAQAISRLLTDRALADKLSSAARRDVVDYDWQCRADRILEFMRRLIP